VPCVALCGTAFGNPGRLSPCAIDDRKELRLVEVDDFSQE
jgi:hypothetical protein